ncbi:uncharacterized protein TRUGW13939_02952 [Talaromyces rugulosus]|uniref:Uncharacterized protein n=1 Tax=Talaromyces rugulosus TaxID=121627 RepID=A0A7H8QRU6_TALRU|nr:uncharacterized protein TRUGW13939_02952 [Talaromyces rugulosus]QKX55853.1 hypothetical protein TRUGW13939_02952 [Talaromyces rugulosus]
MAVRVFETASRAYASNTSLVLVGFFGSGKTTIGIIASMKLNAKLIEFDTFFTNKVGSTPQSYLASVGSVKYREVEFQVTNDLLSAHKNGCVIVGIGAMGSRQQKALLQEFSQTHPVVYVRRDRTELQKFLGCTDEKLHQTFTAGNDFYESCSNFEFYNLTQRTTSLDAASTSHLRLKEVEKSFQRFLHHLYGMEQTRPYSPDPFTPEYTYALQVPLSWFEDSHRDYKELETGADAINLIIDLGSNPTAESLSMQIATIRTNSRVPVIFDVDKNAQLDQESHFKLVKIGLRLAPDILTVPLVWSDELVNKVASQKGSTKFIATYHHRCDWRHSELSAPCERAASLGFDSIRITSDCKAPACNIHCTSFAMQAIENYDIPTSAYIMGRAGSTSVCFNPILSPVCLPSRRDNGVSLREAQKALYASFIRSRSKFTLFGKDLWHSPSPAIHNAAYETFGMPHTFHKLESNNFEEIWSLLNDDAHGGVAVSLPYKTTVLALLDDISPAARDIQAVNTILLDRSATTENEKSKPIMRGYNTDHIGIRDCIYRNLSPANTIRDGSTALIIGAGGMARAAIYACHKLGLRNICIYNRTLDNANKLAEYYNEWEKERFSNSHKSLRVQVLSSLDCPWPEGLRQPTIVISCIPVYQIGNQPSPSLQVPDHWLQSSTGGVCIDLGYQREETNLLKLMREKAFEGWTLVNGLDVLIEQAIAQFELFAKRPAPVHIMRTAIRPFFKTHSETSS